MKYKGIFYIIIAGFFFNGSGMEEREKSDEPNKGMNAKSIGESAALLKKGIIKKPSSYGSYGAHKRKHSKSKTVVFKLPENSSPESPRVEPLQNMSISELIDEYYETKKISAQLLNEVLQHTDILTNKNAIISTVINNTQGQHLGDTKKLFQVFWLCHYMSHYSPSIRNALIINKIEPYLPAYSLKISAQEGRETLKWCIVETKDGTRIFDIAASEGCHLELVCLEKPKADSKIYCVADILMDDGKFINVSCIYKKPHIERQEGQHFILTSDDLGALRASFVNGNKEEYQELLYEFNQDFMKNLSNQSKVYLKNITRFPGNDLAMVEKQINITVADKKEEQALMKKVKFLTVMSVRSREGVVVGFNLKEPQSQPTPSLSEDIKSDAVIEQSEGSSTSASSENIEHLIKNIEHNKEVLSKQKDQTLELKCVSDGKIVTITPVNSAHWIDYDTDIQQSYQ